MTKKTIPKPRKEIQCQANDNPEVTHRNYAEAIIAPEVGAFRILSACEQTGLKEQLDTPALVRLLKDRGEAVNNGDLTHAEQMLASQATALQTLFVRLAERAFASQYIPNTESFLKLALRAQSQCRATLETLATIRNPAVIYARQINQTTGPQQINNGGATPSRRRKTKTEQSKLLEAEDGQRLDTRATSAAIGADPIVATVGTLDGAEVGQGQGDRGTQRRQGRHQGNAARAAGGAPQSS